MRRQLQTVTAWLVLCGAALAAPLQEAQITKVVNDVRVLEPGAAPRPAQLNEKILGQQGIKTGAQSRTELVFSDKTLTRLGANTLFTFKNGTRDMDLQQGTMLLQVPKGAGGAKITTAAVTAAITGTTIMIEAQGAQTSAAASPMGLLSTGQGLQIADPGSSLFRAYRPGETLEAGMSLRTDATNSQAVSPAPGTAVLLEPGTTVTLNPVQNEDKQQHVTVDLKAGNIYAAVSKRKVGNTDFRIRTPYGVAAARGTLFHFSLNLGVSGGVGVAIEGTIEITDSKGGSGTATSGQSLGLNNGAVGGLQTLSPAQMSAFVSAATQLLHLAVDRGALSPELASRVSRSLRDLKVPLSAAQQKLLDQAKGLPDHSTSGSGTGNGYVKVIVLEGTLRLSTNANLGESTLIGAGQMVIMPPNSPVIPSPVVVDVAKLVVTSNLVSGMDPDSSSSDGPKVGALDLKLVIQSVQDQKNDFNSGNLQQTPLFIPGTGTIVQVDTTTAIDNSVNGQQAGPSPTPSVTPGPKNGPPILNNAVDPFPISNLTTIVTDPTLTTGTDVAQGTIWRNQAFDGVFSAYLFGGTGSFDTASQFDVRFLNNQSVFLFSNLQISGNPVIDTTNGPTNLNLVANGSIATSGSPFTFDLSGLNQFSLITKTGNLTIGPEATFTGGASTQNFLLYARGPSSVLDFQGAVDLTANSGAGVDFVGAGNVNLGGSVKAPAVTAYSGAVLTVSGTVEANSFDATALGGISFNPAALVTAGAITLDNRSTTTALDLDPARFNLANTSVFDVYSSATLNLLGNLGLPSLVTGNLNTDIGVDINAAGYSIDAAALFIDSGRDLASGDLNVGTVTVARDFNFGGSTLASAISLNVTGGFISTASIATVTSPVIHVGTVTVSNSGSNLTLDASTSLKVDGAITQGINSLIHFTSPQLTFGSVVSASQLGTRSYSNESITLITGAGLNLDKNLGTASSPFGLIDGYNSTGSTVTGSGNIFASGLKINGSISLGSFDGGAIESKTAGITASGNLTSSGTITAATTISAANAITAVGNISAANGDITTTTGGISSTNGGITALLGNISAGDFISSGSGGAIKTKSLTALGYINSGGSLTATSGAISAGGSIDAIGDISATTSLLTPNNITVTNGGNLALGNITAPDIGSSTQSTGNIWADGNLTATGSVYASGLSINGSISLGSFDGGAIESKTAGITATGSLTSSSTIKAATSISGANGINANGGITASNGGITSTAGGVTSSSGNIYASGDISVAGQILATTSPNPSATGQTITGKSLTASSIYGGSDVTAANGGITTTSGDLIAYGNISATGDISSSLAIQSLGSLTTLSGKSLSGSSIQSGGGMTATNGNITSTTGGISSTNGGISASLGDISSADYIISGTGGSITAKSLTALGHINSGGSLTATNGGISAGGSIDAVGDLSATTSLLTSNTITVTDGGNSTLGNITAPNIGSSTQSTGNIWADGDLTATASVYVAGSIESKHGNITIGTLYGADLGNYTVKAISALLRSITIGSVNAGVSGSLDLSASDTITVTNTSGIVSLDAPTVVLDTLAAQRLVSALPTFGSTLTQLFMKGAGGLDFNDLTNLDIPNAELNVEGPITNSGGTGALTVKSLTTTGSGADVTLSSLAVDGTSGNITVNGNLTLGALSNVGGTIKTTNGGNFSSPVDYTAGNFDIAGDFTTSIAAGTGITSLGYIKVGGILNATRSGFSAVNDIAANSLDISYYTVSTSTGKITVTNGITFGIAGGKVEATTGDVSAGTIFGNGAVTAGQKLTVTGNVGLSNGTLTLVADDLDIQGSISGARGDGISIQVNGSNSPKIAGINLKGLNTFFTPPSGGSFSLVSNADDVRVETGFITPSVDVTGGDQATTDSGVVGNGGSFSIEADKGSISLKSATLNAGPGRVGIFASYGGTGGNVTLTVKTLTADTGTVTLDNSTLQVGRANDKSSETTEVGGSIKLDNNRTSGDGILIQNSSQLYALANPSTEGSTTGSITLTTGGALITVDTSTIKTSGEVRIFGGSVTLANSEIAADSLKVKAFADGGVLQIGGGTLSGDSTLRLYAGNATSGLIHFVGNTTITSQYAPILAAKTVTLDNGITVNVVSNSAAYVFTDVANFSAFNGGNGSTTGMFILNGNSLASGAVVLALGSAPDIDGDAPLSVPPKYGKTILIDTPNPFVINDTTLIRTDPLIRTGNDYGFGTIWRNADTDGLLSTYLFGGANATDLAVEFDPPANGSGINNLAVFKVAGLQLVGNPSVTTTNGPTNLLFLSQGNITTEAASFTFDLTGLNAVGFISESGNITIDSGAVFSGSQANQRLFFYDRATASTLTFNGEINLTNALSGVSFASAGDFLLGGTITAGKVEAFAGGLITVTGTLNVGSLHLDIGGGLSDDTGIVIDPLASITAGELYLNHESTTRVFQFDPGRFGANDSNAPAFFANFEITSDNGIELHDTLQLTDITPGSIRTSNASDLDSKGYGLIARGVNLDVGRDFYSANTAAASAMIGRDMYLSGDFDVEGNLKVNGLLTTTGDGLTQFIEGNMLSLGDIKITNTFSTVSFVALNQLDAPGSLTITDPSSNVVFSSANMRLGFNVLSSQIDPHLVFTEFGVSYAPPSLTITNGASLTLDGNLGDAVDRFGSISGTNLYSALGGVSPLINLRGGGYNLYSQTLNFTGSVNVSGLLDVQGGISASFLSVGGYILATGGDIFVPNGIYTGSTVTATFDEFNMAGRIMAGGIGNSDVYAADITADGDITVNNSLYTNGNVTSHHGNIFIGSLTVSAPNGEGASPLNVSANDLGKTINVGSIQVNQGTLDVTSSTSITVNNTSGSLYFDAPSVTFNAFGDPVRYQSSLPSFGPTVSSLLLDGLGGLTLDVTGGLHLSEAGAGPGSPDIELTVTGPLKFDPVVQGNEQLDAKQLNLNGGIVGDGTTNFTLTSTGSNSPVIHGINLNGAAGDASVDLNPQSGGTLSLFSNNANFKPGEIDNTLTFMGGDQSDPTSNLVGNGGTLAVTADYTSNSDLKMKDSVINAGPGKIGDSATTPYGGTGGNVSLTGRRVQMDNTFINVGRSTNEASETTETGGNINLIAHDSSGPGIVVQNSSQLLALVNAAGSGGMINLKASNGANVTVDSSTIKANKGLVQIVSGSDTGTASGNITLTSSNISADVLKVNAYGPNGQLIVGGGTLNGTSTLKLYAGTTNGQIQFTGNTTLNSSVAPILAASTVTVNNGVTVNVQAPNPAAVYTNAANFSSFNGGNNSTTGVFILNGGAVSGATVQSYTAKPGF